MSPTITFDEDTHTYLVNGRKTPSVTEVMLAERIVDDRWYTDWARERGSAVHQACLYYAQGDLDESSIDPRIFGYLEAFKWFLNEYQMEIIGLETIVHNPLYGYCGRYDILARTLRGIAVIDLKTGVPGRQAGVQTAGYADAIPESPKIRMAVQLKPDGKYSMTEYKDRSDWQVFLSALTLYKWRQAK